MANYNINFLFQCNTKCYVPIGAHLNGLTRFPDFVDGSMMFEGIFWDIGSTKGKIFELTSCFSEKVFRES